MENKTLKKGVGIDLFGLMVQRCICPIANQPIDMYFCFHWIQDFTHAYQKCTSPCSGGMPNGFLKMLLPGILHS